MYQLIVLFFEITIFRKGPQHVPSSPFLLYLVLPAYIAVNVLSVLLRGDWTTALIQIAVDFLLIVGFSWPLLYFEGKPFRFRQTLSALIGTDAVINFIELPAIASLDTQANMLANFALLAFLAWHWLVLGHIFRHALDRSLFFGLGLALLYILISFRVMDFVFLFVSTLT